MIHGWKRVSQDVTKGMADYNSLAVNRVCWLRAKALKARWMEEQILVQYEMGWTVEWFKHQGRQWVTRATATGLDEGDRCYARRQAAMWDSFARKAADGFCQ